MREEAAKRMTSVIQETKTPFIAPTAIAADGAVPVDRAWSKLAVLWLIVALMVSAPSIGASVINAHMANALGMDRTLLGAGFGLFVTTMGLPAPLVAFCLRRFGVRRVMLAGYGLACLGSLLLATVVSDGPGFVACFGLLVGLGVGAAGVLPIQTVVATWFHARRALAVSIMLSAIDIAGFVAPPLFDKVINNTGDWRSGWWLLSGLFTLGALLIWRAVPARLATDPMVIEAQEKTVAVSARRLVYKTCASWPLGQALRTRHFWLVALYVCVSGIAWVFLMSHGVEHLQDIGYSSGHAAMAISIMVAVALAGNGLAGVLGDRLPPHWLGAGALLVLGGGIILAIHPVGLAGLVLFAVPLGFGYGASQVCFITVLGNYFGPKIFPALYGITLAPGTVSAAVGAAVAGAIFDHQHTYEPMFLACAVLVLFGAVALACATPAAIRRRAESL
jgi:MFS family permease